MSFIHRLVLPAMALGLAACDDPARPDAGEADPVPLVATVSERLSAGAALGDVSTRVLGAMAPTSAITELDRRVADVGAAIERNDARALARAIARVDAQVAALAPDVAADRAAELDVVELSLESARRLIAASAEGR